MPPPPPAAGPSFNLASLSGLLGGDLSHLPQLAGLANFPSLPPVSLGAVWWRLVVVGGVWWWCVVCGAGGWGWWSCCPACGPRVA